ncbi:MAG TPA: type II secretion system protein GspE [Deltaproteobacteria bacterium]|nr:type II secretion system protein GspE [Deltaproteobacteria bacterium]
MEPKEELFKMAPSGKEVEFPKRASKKRGLGRLAVEAGLITDQQLSLAIYEQEKTGKLLPDLLQELYGLGAETIQYLLAEDAGIERVDIARVRVDQEALKKVPSQFASEHKLLPISLSQNRLTVAMANPFDLATLDQLQFMTRLDIDARFAPESKIVEAIEKFYRGTVNGSAPAEKKEEKESYASVQEGEATIGPQVVRLVDALIGRAIREEATDIHVEPEEKSVGARFRVDGILHNRPNISKILQPAVITRIKIMANIDISENRVPQDGRISFPWEGRNYDLRVSTFPTIYGEKIVMRVLDKERVILGLEQLGFSPSALAIFRKSIQRPNGIILVTGPTGSGKTTTLYSTLAFVNSTERNIMTLEDPVEYEIPDIHQSQINPKAGLTFASGLRAILRQDPDIILVGEMRDAETVDVAIRAALTGHLVFSTLHTNDAVGSIPRLLDMDVNPSLMASTFVAIIGQRLVRKVCPHCKEVTMPDESLLQLVGISRAKQEDRSTFEVFHQTDKQPVVVNREKQEITFYHGKGCTRCFQTGYRGRIGIFEILALSPAISQMIAQRSSAQAILQKAREEGMTTMMEDGVEKAGQGVTTLEEVIRVAYQA